MSRNDEPCTNSWDDGEGCLGDGSWHQCNQRGNHATCVCDCGATE